MVKIAKEFHWEMAHRLPYHKAGCQNIHGHSYRIWIELEGEPDAGGMVMDYADLKNLVKPIVDKLDHCFLCSADDTVMVEFLKDQSFKVVHVDFPTTAENIAGYFMNLLKARLKSCRNIVAVKIKVCETPSSYAEVAAELKNGA